MQFFKLGSNVKFRAFQDQAYDKGMIVGHAFLNRNGEMNPIYLVELHEGFYRPDNSQRSPMFISTIPVSCDCVEADE